MSDRYSIETELREGARVLEEAGVLNPTREATSIWAALVGVQPGDVWLTREDVAPESLANQFRELTRRRAEGEPLPYVVGIAGFRKLDLKVDKRALIPRPETEGLVHLVLEWCESREWAAPGNWGLAVDVGTGTGCIALSLAVEGRFARVVAIEKSQAALDLAAENVSAVAPKTPVELRNGSLLDSVDETSVSVIVSNPPYVTVSEYYRLEQSVTNFEPREALVSDDDGIEHTRTLLETAACRMITGGLLAIEVDSTRAGMVHNLARKLGWPNTRIEADLFGRPRFLLATKET